MDPKYYKFGCSLDDIYEHSGEDVPLAVAACVSFLERSGLKEEGLFRVPGSSNEVDEIKTKLEQGKNPFVAGGRSANPEAAATCLKLYLRELAEPVISRDLYTEFVKAGRLGDAQMRVAGLKTIVRDKLAIAHRELLKVLLPFLHLVAQYSAANKMTTSNLALVFGPTLMPAPRDDMAAMLRDSTAVNNVMLSLIEAWDHIFPELATERAAAAASIASSPAVVDNKDSTSSAHISDAQGQFDGEKRDVGVSESETHMDPRTEFLEVEPEPESAEEDDEDDDDSVEIGRVLAKHDYAARTESELSFKAGDMLIIFNNFGKDWSLGCTVQNPSLRKFIANAYVEPWQPGMQEGIALGSAASEESHS